MSIGVAALKLAGAVLSVVGCLVWSSRLDYSPEKALTRQLGERLIDIDPNVITDLSSACSTAGEDDGWVLFVLDADLTSDTTARTFFETADERFGLWVEYDPGLLRLGQGLGADSLASNTEIPIRWVRRDERAFIAIAVSTIGTRVVTNAIDKQNAWPGDLVSVWRCDKVQIGSDTRELSEGKECMGCDARLRFATGENLVELETLLDNLSNVNEFNAKRWIGTCLTFVGFLVLVRRIRIRSPWRNTSHDITSDQRSTTN
jgi:hypothetical protein